MRRSLSLAVKVITYTHTFVLNVSGMNPNTSFPYIYGAIELGDLIKRNDALDGE